MLPILSISTNEEARFGNVVDRLADQLGLAPEDRRAASIRPANGPQQQGALG
jgi:hypothetical protein